jgi:hypothetical protein
MKLCTSLLALWVVMSLVKKIQFKELFYKGKMDV